MRAIRTAVFLLICIGLIWAIVALVVRGFRSGNTTTTTTKPLTSYAQTDAQAQLVIDGPIVQATEHNSVRITVSRSQTQIEVLQGYDGQVLTQRAYANSENGYEDFLAALDKLGFSKSFQKGTAQTEQGVCPVGTRYVYTLDDTSKQIGRAWSSTCSGGTMSNTRTQIRTLFVKQIPEKEYLELTRGLNI